jgi:plasmid stabilization system protein ParE
VRGLVWSNPAKRDLFRIAFDEWLIDPLELIERIEAAPLVLLTSPEIGSPTRKRGIRKWIVRKTPFILFYIVKKDRVEFRRVVHSASNWAIEF